MKVVHSLKDKVENYCPEARVRNNVKIAIGK